MGLKASQRFLIFVGDKTVLVGLSFCVKLLLALLLGLRLGL